MLEKLKQLKDLGKPLVITPSEYQDLCREVFDLGMPRAADYDDLILNYQFEGLSVLVEEETE